MPDRASWRTPVWGFPIGYSPNQMGDVCERCRRTGLWVGRVLPERAFMAWTCQCCLPQPRGPVAIPE